jgi:hypothetical protein
MEHTVPDPTTTLPDLPGPYIPNIPTPLVPFPAGTQAVTVLIHPNGTTYAHTPPSLSRRDFHLINNGNTALTAFIHIVEFFSHSIDACDTGPIPQLTWLKSALFITLHIHNSLHCTMTAPTEGMPPIPNPFDNLNPEEHDLLQCLVAGSSALDQYFTSSQIDHEDWDVCMRCLKECNVAISEDAMQAALMSMDQNIRAAYSTIYNNALCTLTHDVDLWIANHLATIKRNVIHQVIDHPLNPTDPDTLAWIWDTAAHIKDRVVVTLTTEDCQTLIQPFAIESMDEAHHQATEEATAERVLIIQNAISNAHKEAAHAYQDTINTQMDVWVRKGEADATTFRDALSHK